MFGLSWLGNSATIKCTPLFNILVVCGNLPPTIMSIFGCIEHMSAGGKKDATFIMEHFKEKSMRLTRQLTLLTTSLTGLQMYRQLE